MPQPRKLPPPDPADVKALAMEYATTGPMPWYLAVAKAEQRLRERARAAAKPCPSKKDAGQFAKGLQTRALAE